MCPEQGSGRTRGLVLGLLVASALAAACGNDLPNYVYDCCTPAGLYYVCQSHESFGRCRSSPPDTTGCTFQTNPCPENPRQ